MSTTIDQNQICRPLATYDRLQKNSFSHLYDGVVPDGFSSIFKSQNVEKRPKSVQSHHP